MPSFSGADIEQPIGFDPYRAWLGVRELRRPLNAYQLLLLAEGESDTEVIHAAAAAQRAALMAHRHEATPDLWLQIHEELEAAIETLTDPDRKAAYDLALANSPQVSVRPDGALGVGTGGSVLRCRRCGARNPANRRFCAQCGAHLWEPCIKCSTICASGERFCGACGANIDAAVKSELERIEAIFIEAVDLQRQSRYDEAIDLLAPITHIEHPRLTDCVRRANDLIRQLAAQRDRRRTTVEEKLAEARSFVQKHDYLGALTLLRTVPDALRTDEVREVIADCTVKLQEIEALESDLKAAVASKRFDGVLRKIERLLTLKPNHAAAKDLATRLEEHLCRAAEQAMAEGRFEKARQMLEQTPVAVRSEKVSALIERASEIAMMLYDLQHAPYIDETLIDIATRCRKVLPENRKVASVCSQLMQRAAAPRQPPYAPATWAAAPAETPWKMPVEWLWRLAAVQPSEVCDISRWSQERGDHIVAIGLALQALGLGPMRMCFIPRDYHSVLGRMKQLIRFRARTAVGIDIGDSGVKAVKLSVGDMPTSVRIECATVVAHRKPLTQAVNEAEEDRLVEDSLKRVASMATLHADRWAVGFSSRGLLLRPFKLPPVPTGKLAPLVEFEARVQSPIDLNDLCWAFQTAEELQLDRKAESEGRNEPPKREHEILFAAVKKPSVLRLLTRCQAAGLTIDLVQADALALYNAVFFDLFVAKGSAESNGSAGRRDDEAVLIVDIGADGARLIGCGPEWLWFRNVGVGGRSFTRALIQQFNLTYQQAEELKTQPHKAPLIHPVIRTFEPVFSDLLNELQSSLDVIRKSFPERKLAKLFILGGSAKLHGLLRVLRTGK